MTEGKNSNQPARNNLRIYESVRNITTDQRHDYTTACLLEYS